MTGKFVAGAIAVVAILFGAAMYYFQVYAYYEPVNEPDNGVILTTLSGEQEPILVQDFQGIDATSSPIRYRACFTTPTSIEELTEKFAIYENAEPLTAPAWFECFDAVAIGEGIEAGQSVAFLSEKNVQYGVDRVIAVNNKGQAFAWHQLNNCGEKTYDGSTVGEECPSRNLGAE